MKIINVVGARPNFMKIAPIHKQMQMSSLIEPILVHTGQHYDEKMSKVFFNNLHLPKPNVYLGVGSSTHAEQTAKIMIEFEKVLLEYKPDLVIVVGDVNSTVACAIDSVKLQIPVAHVEAGLRSFDREMPEEINRIITDGISDFLFVSEQSGVDNLSNEGIDQSKIHFVGNVMIDSLVNHMKEAENSNILNKLGLENKEFGLVTLHRPSNVDNKHSLIEILSAFKEINKNVPLVFPVHPRTHNNITKLGMQKLIKSMSQLHLIEPVDYYDFLHLMQSSKFVLTDSGGIQEETTYLGIPCLTLRKNTERPITLDIGTNKLVELSTGGIISAFNAINNKDIKSHSIPKYWDGKTAQRIVHVIQKYL